MTDARFVNQRMVGSSVIPDEAIPLVEGDGRFLNDIKLPGMYHVAFLRSQHAHARLNSVDVSEARKLPGIIKVLTGKELLSKVEPFRSMPRRYLVPLRPGLLASLPPPSLPALDVSHETAGEGGVGRFF